MRGACGMVGAVGEPLELTDLRVAGGPAGTRQQIHMPFEGQRIGHKAPNSCQVFYPAPTHASSSTARPRQGDVLDQGGREPCVWPSPSALRLGLAGAPSFNEDGLHEELATLPLPMGGARRPLASAEGSGPGLSRCLSWGLDVPIHRGCQRRGRHPQLPKMRDAVPSEDRVPNRGARRSAADVKTDFISSMTGPSWSNERYMRPYGEGMMSTPSSRSVKCS